MVNRVYICVVPASDFLLFHGWLVSFLIPEGFLLSLVVRLLFRLDHLLLLRLCKILVEGILHLLKGLFDNHEFLFDLDDLVLLRVNGAIFVSDRPPELCNVHIQGAYGLIFLNLNDSKLLVLVLQHLELISHSLHNQAVFTALFQESLLVLFQFGLEIRHLLFHLILDSFQLFLMLRLRRGVLLTFLLQKLLL